MLLTLSTTARPATDLGFLLHKHPDRAQSFEVAVGTAHVLWPEATPERSTVALLLEVDPIALVRGRGNRGADSFALAQHATTVRTPLRRCWPWRSGGSSGPR